jgi:hypothetical protein
MRVENPIHPADAVQIGYEPVTSLPADFFERTVAVERGPVGSPETGYAAVVDFMPAGYAIEKNPEPIATGIFEAPSPEAVLDSIVESPDAEDGPKTSRFQPYELHMDMDYDVRDSTLPKGITLVTEEGIVKPVLAEADPEGTDSQSAEETEGSPGRAKAMLTALRRSRLGKVAAVTAIATGELLSLGTGSAQGADAQLEQECLKDALSRPQFQNTQMRRAGIPGVQNMFARVINPEVPAYCADDFNILRIERYKFRVQDAQHRARMVSVRPVWTTFKVGNDGGADPIYVTADNSGRALYECTKGRKTTAAEVDVKIIVKDTETGETLGKQVHEAPIKKISPHRC